MESTTSQIVSVVFSIPSLSSRVVHSYRPSSVPSSVLDIPPVLVLVLDISLSWGNSSCHH